MKVFLTIAILIFISTSQKVIRDSRGNQVQGKGNVWNGVSNSIRGEDNLIDGNSNVIHGSTNSVKGNNNYVGKLSKEDMARMEKQMADRLASRFGNRFDNIFSRVKTPKPSPRKKSRISRISNKNQVIRTKSQEIPKQEVKKKKIIQNEVKEVRTKQLENNNQKRKKITIKNLETFQVGQVPPVGFLFSSYGRRGMRGIESLYMTMADLATRLGRVRYRKFNVKGDRFFSSVLGVIRKQKGRNHL